MSYKARLTKPEKGNKYYITKANGGYSNAIKGKPTDKDCDVLSNCVGYAYGRFNEIGGYGKCKYLSPVNAEKFMQYKGSCKTGSTPKLGACMVWQKGSTLNGSDGAGHVAIVEKIISPTEIVTSESGYGASKPFWTQTRKKGTGNWGQASSYKFLGFIYNPAVSDSESTQSTQSTSKPTASSTTSLKYKKGDIVKFAGGKNYINANATVGTSRKAGTAKITNTSPSGKHVYHLIAEKNGGSNVYGWVDASTITGLVNNKSTATSTFKSYTVKVTANSLNIRKGAGTNYGTNGSIRDKGIYTIVAESTGQGAKKWGKLKSGAGWISLDYCKKV